MIASKPLLIATLTTLLALGAACDSKGGGASCFAPEVGPSGPSCAGYDDGLSCPVSVSPFYTCVCTSKTWVCNPAGATTSGGGMGGMAGAGGTGGATGTGGTGGTGGASGTGGAMGTGGH